jgi:hypothetical protein
MKWYELDGINNTNERTNNITITTNLTTIPIINPFQQPCYLTIVQSHDTSHAEVQ